MQIYTRVGDKGQTKINGNYTVSKNSIRVEAYGTVDELNSFVGSAASSPEAWPELTQELQQIQQFLFDCGNDLATSNTNKYPYRTNEKPTEWLENIIDAYSKEPKPLESFILPGGSRLAAELHVCRTVTRRTERAIVSFNHYLDQSKVDQTYETNRKEADANPHVLKFINRLSDYFFAVARVANHRLNQEDVLYERSGKVFHLNVKKEDFEK
ncbi:cob(I)yrinic acid a,c-diamide adenosyltransferase [Fundicoccus culcitae]|uniref:Corrinoid adenosyltransferase n=1 Tax=Fundicoccus culcitae TaxID=2969821 RepID=A0ABY5P555_9LACT|nr:cob(I)yrinic acid a,c-diamide adenosyltransferase [Fundicoccus culcitae]UUX33510.1 cob(I)yrinic acid a,c-diamide adenosyltransferase [Fundicoccus culcitae]